MAQHFAPATMPALAAVALPMQLSDRIMLAYSDPELSTADFEALVREIYGDEPEEGL